MPIALVTASPDQVREATLFVSTDEGKTWERWRRRPRPSKGSYTLPEPPRDGVYWFGRRGRPPGGGGRQEALTHHEGQGRYRRSRRGEATAPSQSSSIKLEEARLNVEFLELELSTQKTQLRQYVQTLTQSEFGFVGLGGGMGGGMGGMGGGMGGAWVWRFLRWCSRPRTAEERTSASLRERHEEPKSAVLVTAKKVGEARRRLAAIEGRTEHSTTSDSPLASDRGALAEQRARLSLLEIAFEVDREMLREAMTKLGKLELDCARLIPSEWRWQRTMPRRGFSGCGITLKRGHAFC